MMISFFSANAHYNALSITSLRIHHPFSTNQRTPPAIPIRGSWTWTSPCLPSPHPSASHATAEYDTVHWICLDMNELHEEKANRRQCTVAQ